MLFNSYEFLFFFLPFVFTVHRLLIHWQAPLAFLLTWICACSLFFYAWWQPIYLLLLGMSLLCNFLLIQFICNYRNVHSRQGILIVGIAFNLGLLTYYKYAAFIFENLHSIGLSNTSIPDIVLPLAISFFTFQQIAYLVTCYKDPSAKCSLLEHVFFITFFPHLIAGPIVYKNELVDQVRANQLISATSRHWEQGLTLFILGLSKKLLVSDTIAQLINPLYEGGGPQGSFDAWIGTLFFGFQIYFDFSAYSDMALGIAYLFGLKLPLNFDSPYKAVTYRDFWRRWHITLFRFFKDHIYIPLNTNNTNRTYTLFLSFIVFFLSGLWHGAAWTFIAWGIINWLLIIIHDAWNALSRNILKIKPSLMGEIAGKLYVFFSMSFTFMLFRSPDFSTAQIFIEKLISPSGIHSSFIISSMRSSNFIKFIPLSDEMLAVILLAFTSILLLAVWLLPNAVRYCIHEHNESPQPTKAVKSKSGIFIGILAWLCIMALPKSTAFIYFQF